MPKPPLVLLIGGASGTGKTTLANLLVQELDLAHHVSTGFVREVVKSVLPDTQAELLDSFAFDTWHDLQAKSPATSPSVVEGALTQAALLLPAIQACINRSIREGASLVLEGSHLLPGLFDTESLGISRFVVLDVPNTDVLLQRAQGHTHALRNLSSEQLSNIVELQKGYLELAALHEIPVINNTEVQHSIKQIKELLSTVCI